MYLKNLKSMVYLSGGNSKVWEGTFHTNFPPFYHFRFQTCLVKLEVGPKGKGIKSELQKWVNNKRSSFFTEVELSLSYLTSRHSAFSPTFTQPQNIKNKAFGKVLNPHCLFSRTFTYQYFSPKFKIWIIFANWVIHKGILIV